MKRLIYADNAATTALSTVALEAMLPYLREDYGNPSSIHAVGESARRAVDDARSAIAEILNCSPDEVIFTSGATESDNLAVHICLKYGISRGKKTFILSPVEHHAVSRPAESLSDFGVTVTHLCLNSAGKLDKSALTAAIADSGDICGVSVMLANNETGTVFDICSLSTALRGSGALFHTDATQAVGHIPVDFRALGVDMLSLSAHKFHGPKGVGALICKRGTPFSPFILGGAQENSHRAGTENVAGIVGMAAALTESAKNLESDARYVSGLRERLTVGLSDIPGFAVNPGGDLPGILSVRFAGADGEAIVRALDLFGIAASAGAACNSVEVRASHVLIAMGLDESEAASAVRFSLDRMNTEDDIAQIVAAMKKIFSVQ